ncbi:PREDICTED: uncharacterized protein LOC109155214 [Ipomoea nil]|uniref:uncharacterized protein LOC109155214 n=1 Tax=Ipomoea nil TaxID=35883 RepID=UPI000900AC3A|nr:PREDICTED: uncharacterized protein LOC109155214 [Ipomoea nil]
MSDDGSSTHTTGINSDDLTTQLANLIKNGLNSQNQNQKQNLSDRLKISVKLNNQNYALWARMIRVAIGGKSKTLLSHLSGNPAPPDPKDEKYVQWEQDDLVVFSWLIQNIKPALASNLTEFPTAKSLWDALVVTYSSGKDKLQTFDLHVKTNEIKQNGAPLEDFGILMQGIWGEIERRDPNPMTCAADIATYNKLRAEQKLFQFLNAIDRQYDPIKREILRWDPLTSAEGAYAAVRNETAHQNILGAVSAITSSQQGVAAGLTVTGPSEAEGLGLISKGQRRSDQTGRTNGSSSRPDKSQLNCSHCGMSKHTKEQCFKIVGYPEWWNDGHKQSGKTTRSNGGRAAAAVRNNDTTINIGDGQGNIREGGFGGMAAVKRDDETGKGFGDFSSSPSFLNPKYFPQRFLKLVENTLENTTDEFIGRGYLKTIKTAQKCVGKANMAQNYCGKQDKSWILDCGATDTMTFELSDIISSSKTKKTHIQAANGEIMHVEGGGTIEISPTIKLSNCLYVPSLSHKLLSISHVTKELNCTVLMHPTFCILQDIRTGVIIGRGTERQGLYYVDEVTQRGTVMLAHGTVDCEAWLWHRRLGHPSNGYLHILLPKLFPSNNMSKCETCVLAKSHRQTFKPNNTRVDLPFSLIHSDVWGPAPIIGGQNFRFFLIFVDDCTRMTWVYFLKHKSEVFDKFTMFYAMIQTQFQKNIQIFRSDNGGEFVNTHMQQFFQKKGIIHQTTCPHTPEQNGVVERKNRILLEITRALLIESRVPKSFWPEAIATAAYLINRLPTNILKLKTPLQTLSGFTKVPPALTLQPRIFGCSIFVHIPKTNRTKLDPCAEKCVFIGYGVNQKGYRCYNPKTRQMFTTMNCDFLETEYYYNSQHSGQGEKGCLDTVSWLKYVSSSEEINHSTKDESLNTPTQSVEPIVSAIENAPPNLMPEVSNTYSSDTHSSTSHSPEHIESSGSPSISFDLGEKTTEQVELVR